MSRGLLAGFSRESRRLVAGMALLARPMKMMIMMIRLSGDKRCDFLHHPHFVTSQPSIKAKPEEDAGPRAQALGSCRALDLGEGVALLHAKPNANPQGHGGRGPQLLEHTRSFFMQAGLSCRGALFPATRIVRCPG